MHGLLGLSQPCHSYRRHFLDHNRKTLLCCSFLPNWQKEKEKREREKERLFSQPTCRTDPCPCLVPVGTPVCSTFPAVHTDPPTGPLSLCPQPARPPPPAVSLAATCGSIPHLVLTQVCLSGWTFDPSSKHMDRAHVECISWTLDQPLHWSASQCPRLGFSWYPWRRKCRTLSRT